MCSVRCVYMCVMVLSSCQLSHCVFCTLCIYMCDGVEQLSAEPLCVLYVVYMCDGVEQLSAEPLWTVDTQKNQQTITNVVAKRAVGMYLGGR